ncbi:MAG: DegV family protein [Dehalococcoidia bacterium]|nr:DegV family protein [Dehalococcoidia bacterium]
MDKVAIVADSTACLTREMVEQYGIKIVPVYVHFAGKVYRDGVDISPSEAFMLLEKDPEHFATSAPSPGDYLEAFRELSEKAESILCITISAKFSMLHDAARMAKEQAKEELPQTQIELLDSYNAAAAEGFVVLAAARAVAEGKGLAEAIKAAEAVRERVAFFALMETIRYVYRSGRIPKVAAQIGSAFSVKPIITISEGAAHFVGIARTKERGVNRLLQLMREKVGENPVHIAVIHADALEEAERLKERVASEFNCEELWLSEFSPIMGYATGRGVVGLAFYSET